jgi:predicted alpha/beta-fold hydrolase
MIIPTIATLRRSGYKVRVLHTRNYKKVLKICGIFEELSAKGGHVGFISGHVPGKPVFWLDQRIPEYLQGYLAVRTN